MCDLLAMELINQPIALLLLVVVAADVAAAATTEDIDHSSVPSRSISIVIEASTMVAADVVGAADEAAVVKEICNYSACPAAANDVEDVEVVAVVITVVHQCDHCNHKINCIIRIHCC